MAFALESAGWPEEKIRARAGRAFHELGLESLARRSIFRLSRWAAPEDRPREHLGPAAAEPAAGRADEQSGYALHRGYHGLRREREGIGPLDPGGRAPTDSALRHRRYLCPPRRRPYGAGKTTLCRTLCGFERKARGTLFLDGRRPSRRHRIRASSTVFQDVRYQLFAESAAAEVTFGLSRRQASAVDTDAVLRELALDDVAGRHPATPSGDQKQRLAVATCVAAGKRVLVFDEPTSGNDLDGMRRVARLLRRLADQDRAVLVITHDLELIACACDLVLHIEDGRIASRARVHDDFDTVRATTGTTARALQACVSSRVSDRIRSSTKAAPGRPGTIDVAVPGMNDRVRQDTPRCMQKAAPQPRARAVVTARVRAASARVRRYNP